MPIRKLVPTRAGARLLPAPQPRSGTIAGTPSRRKASSDPRPLPACFWSYIVTSSTRPPSAGSTQRRRVVVRNGRAARPRGGRRGSPADRRRTRPGSAHRPAHPIPSGLGRPSNTESVWRAKCCRWTAASFLETRQASAACSSTSSDRSERLVAAFKKRNDPPNSREAGAQPGDLRGERGGLRRQRLAFRRIERDAGGHGGRHVRFERDDERPSERRLEMREPALR